MSRRCWLAVALLAVTAVPASSQTKLEWKLKEGDKFFLEIDSISKVTAKPPMADAVKETTDHTMVASMNVLKRNADDTIRIEQRIEAVKVKNAPRDFGKVLQGMEGTTLRFTLSPKMRITKLEGYDDLVKRAVGTNELQAKVFRSIMTEDVVKEFAHEAFAFLPDKPVRAGDTWNRQLKASFGGLGTLSVRHNYVYRGAETRDGKPVHKIVFEPAISYAPPAAGTGLFGLTITKADLKVEKSKGNIWFDATTGRLVQSEMEMLMKGTMGISVAGGQSVDMQIEQDDTVRIRVLDKNPLAK